MQSRIETMQFQDAPQANRLMHALPALDTRTKKARIIAFPNVPVIHSRSISPHPSSFSRITRPSANLLPLYSQPNLRLSVAETPQQETLLNRTASASQAGQTGAPSYKEHPVVRAKLEKHQLTAVACLFTGDLAKLDPTTGDASCQVRALVVLVFYYDLRKTLDHKEWDNAVALSRGYLEAHAADKVDTQAKTIKDVQGAGHSKEFDGIVDVVRDHLGEDRFELLGLTYSLWTAGIVSTDEFWIDFRYRNNSQWGIHGKWLRARLAKLSCEAFIDLAAELPAEGKWVETLQKTRSVIKNDGADDVPVLSIQATFSVALAILYERGIPILDGNVRIQLNGDGQPQQADPSDRSDPPEPLSTITYTFGTGRILLYVPNRKAGTFDIVKNPTAVQMNSPAFFVKSWSTFYGASTDTGLYSADHELYYAARAKIDVQWAIDVYASLHPPFTRRAVDTDLDITAVYEQIFVPRAKTFKYDCFALEGLNYLVPHSERPNLAERQNLAMRVAHQRRLNGGCHFVRIGAPGDECTSRITKAIDWQIVHVSAATPKWVKDQLQAFADRHKEAAGAVIGRYVFSLGAVGASHEVEDEATSLHRTRKEPARRKKYLGRYPDNEPLLRR